MEIEEIKKVFNNIKNVYINQKLGSINLTFSGHLDINDKGYINIVASNNHIFIYFDDIVSYDIESYPQNFLSKMEIYLKDDVKINLTYNN